MLAVVVVVFRTYLYFTYVGVCHACPCACCTCTGQKRVLDSLELELRVAVSRRVGAENQTQALQEQSVLLPSPLVF